MTRFPHSGLARIVALSGLLALAPMGAGPAVADLSPSGLAALDRLAADPSGARAALGVAPLVIGLPQKAAVAAPDGPAMVEVTDLKLVLAQLAILAGANDHLALLQAQSGDDAVVLRQGQADLAGLAAVAGPALRSDGAGGWVLTRPLVVWQGAALTLGPGDRLTLSTEDGAFVLVFGRIDIQGATLRATAGDPAVAFRPFLLAAGSAELSVDAAQFQGLGFAAGGLFGGVAVLSSGLFPPASPVRVTGSIFAGPGSLSLRQTIGAVVAGNRFVDGSRVEVLGGSHLLMSDTVITDSAGGVALRLSGGLTDAIVANTTIVNPQGSGVGISGLAQRIVLASTVVDGAQGTAITANRARCLRMQDLALTRGAAAGLRLRATGQAQVRAGLIHGNAGAAVDVIDQPADAPLALADLWLAENRVGLAGAGSTDIGLLRVDLSQQLPRLFAGDLAPFTAAFLTAVQQAGDASFALRLPPVDRAAPAPLVLAAALATAPLSPQPATAFLPPGADPWPAACLTE